MSGIRFPTPGNGHVFFRWYRTVVSLTRHDVASRRVTLVITLVIILSNTDEVIGRHRSDEKLDVLCDHIVKSGRVLLEITTEERIGDVHIRGLHRWKLEDGLIESTVSIGVHVLEHGFLIAESRVQVDALHGNGSGKVQHLSRDVGTVCVEDARWFRILIQRT